MKKEIIEKLALIYVSKNLGIGESAEKAVELYEKACKEISDLNVKEWKFFE